MTKAVLSLIVLFFPIQALAEPEDQALVKKPWTYQECIKKASDINSKWIEYRIDVNDCRSKYGIPGQY